MSRVLARRRLNWRGVRSGVLRGAEGKIVMWRGLFCCLLVLEVGSEDGIGITFLPITPRQAIEGIAVIMKQGVGL